MKSMQRQLTLRILLAVLGISLAAGAFVYFHARETLLEEYDHALTAKARLVAGIVTLDEKGHLEFTTTDAETAEFRRPLKPAYFEIWAGTGDPFERSPSLDGKDLPRLPASRKGGATDLLLPDGRAGRAAGIQFTPRVDEDEPRPVSNLPILTLVIAQDRHELNETLRTLATSLALAAIAMSAGAAIAVIISVRRGLRPLNALARQADTIGAGSLDQHFPVQGIPAELQPICVGLNDLLKRLSEAFGRERRFTADAAHELRTPIAELRALAEVAIKWPGDACGEQNYREVLQIATPISDVATLQATLPPSGV